MNWQAAIAPRTSTVRDIISAIDRGGLQIALICDDDQKLRGIVTDGDVRRALIRGSALDAPIAPYINASPTVVREEDDRSKAVAYMQQFGIYQVPVIDRDGRLVGVESLHKHAGERVGDTVAVIMAGGLGSRLAPLTDTIPKPLIKVGGSPILETIVRQLAACGIRQMVMCINYKADMIRAHFEDGSRWGVSISYVEESERRGTAGALALLKRPPTSPFLVLNADILTSIDFAALLEFHSWHEREATMCVREHRFQVPYGIVEVEGYNLRGLTEKPEYTYFINAGIYVLNPALLTRIPDGAFYNMTDLFEALLAEGHRPSVFPIMEYWLDIGRMDELERARKDFDVIFPRRGTA